MLYFWDNEGRPMARCHHVVTFDRSHTVIMGRILSPTAANVSDTAVAFPIRSIRCKSSRAVLEVIDAMIERGNMQSEMFERKKSV